MQRLQDNLSIDITSLSNVMSEKAIKKIAYLIACDLDMNFNKKDFIDYVNILLDLKQLSEKDFSKMSNNEFEITENGILRKYNGKGGTVFVPENVTRIDDEAFSGCDSLTSITLPESVTEIGYRAFSDCSSLKSIMIPEGVTEIGFKAFCGCSRLSSITIP